MLIYINKGTVRVCVCVCVCVLPLTQRNSLLQYSVGLSVSNTYINGTTLPVSQLEQGGGFAATAVLVINKGEFIWIFPHLI